MVSDLRFLLLGSVEVRRAGVLLPLTSNKLRILLAALALKAGKTVPTDTIIDCLWGDRASKSARGTVHVYALRLRRLLGEDVISTRPNGYSLQVADDQIDVSAFRDLVARARRADDPTTEWELLTEAVALWRGQALSDVVSESLRLNLVPLLTEERLQAVERRAEIGVELGLIHGLAAELTEMTRLHPLRERLWALLMLALDRSGRTVEALAAYQNVRRLFVDELGIDVSASLQRVHQEILAKNSKSEAPPTPLEVCPAQLPADVRAFVSRTEVIEQLIGELSASGMPLVLLTGSPGVGKTALASHVAHQVRHQYPDGQLYANLQGHSPTPPSQTTVVLARFLRAMGVPEDQVPSDLDDQTNLYRSLLAGRRVLVVLDNASGPRQVRRLLPSQPGCAVLITSRNDLRGLIALDGGRQIPLGPLTPDESQTVLADVLGAARVNAEPTSTAELVDLCARLPTALRIAAANLRTRPDHLIADYVAELRARGRLNQLRVPGDEQAAVHAAFDLSYARLDFNEASMFRRLSLAPGQDISVPAAAALQDCAHNHAAVLLDTLTGVNLVSATGAGRYQMHDLLSEYAAERAAQDSDASEAAIRVFDFYLHTADAASRMLYPDTIRAPWSLPSPATEPLTFDTEASALEWLDRERANIAAAAHQAAKCGLTKYGWQIAGATHAYFSARGHAAEALVVCAAALTAAQAANETYVEAYMLDFLGAIHFRVSKYAEAQKHHLDALELFQRNGDVRGQATCLRHLGRISAQLGQPGRTIQYHQKALDLAVVLSDPDEQAININYIGLAHQSAGRMEQATEWHQRALDLAHQTGNESIRSAVRNGLGLAAWNRGELQEAIHHQRAAISSAQAASNQHLHAGSAICLAEALCAAGEYNQAIAEARAALNLRTGEKRHEIGAAEIITTVRLLRGERIGIIEDYQQILRQAREITFKHGEVSVLISLATAYRLAGQPLHAAWHARKALAIMRDNGMRALEHRAEVELGLSAVVEHSASG